MLERFLVNTNVFICLFCACQLNAVIISTSCILNPMSLMTTTPVTWRKCQNLQDVYMQ